MGELFNDPIAKRTVVRRDAGDELNLYDKGAGVVHLPALPGVHGDRRTFCGGASVGVALRTTVCHADCRGCVREFAALTVSR